MDVYEYECMCVWGVMTNTLVRVLDTRNRDEINQSSDPTDCQVCKCVCICRLAYLYGLYGLCFVVLHAGNVMHVVWEPRMVCLAERLPSHTEPVALKSSMGFCVVQEAVV